MKTLTVQELIDKLNLVKDKSKPVFGYIITAEDTYEVVPINLVDDSISDRVDLNFDTNGEY